MVVKVVTCWLLTLLRGDAGSEVGNLGFPVFPLHLDSHGGENGDLLVARGGCR